MRSPNCARDREDRKGGRIEASRSEERIECVYIYIHARARAFLCVCVCVLMHTLHAFWPRKQLHSPNYLAISQDRIQNRQIERSCVGPSQSCNKHKDRYEDASARVKDRYTEECVCVCARALACVHVMYFYRTRACSSK